MGHVTISFRIFATAAGVNGIIQGVVWSALSISAIVSYHLCDVSDTNLTAMEIFWSYIHKAYFMDPTCPGSLHDTFETLNLNVLRPQHLLIWTSIFLAVSFLWVLSSSLLLIGANSKAVNNYLIAYCLSSSFLTFSISCLDIAIGILFGFDFATFAARYDYRNVENTQDYLFLSAGSFALMTLSFRGYIFIFINLIFAFYLLVQSFGLNKDSNEFKHNIHSQGPLHAYDRNTSQNNPWNLEDYADRSIPRLRDGYTNNAFENAPQSSSNSNYERSHSWHEVKMTQQRPKIQHEPLKDPDTSVRNSQIQSTAAMSPSMFSPYTPMPDYSPPAARQTYLKPTLKHNYQR